MDMLIFLIYVEVIELLTELSTQHKNKRFLLAIKLLVWEMSLADQMTVQFKKQRFSLDENRRSMKRRKVLQIIGKFTPKKLFKLELIWLKLSKNGKKAITTSNCAI